MRLIASTLWRTSLVSCLLLFGLCGCAGRFVAFDACPSGREPDYGAVLGRLEASALASRDRDRLLYLMEKGLLLREDGALVESNQVLEEADRLADELFTRSLSATGFSFVSNDFVLPYYGEDFEVAYLNYFKALNYLELGDLGAARIECRRVDEKLNVLVDAYGGKNVFKESPLLRLLTGLIYEAQGEWNDAFIAYRKSLEAYESYRDKYRVAVPRLLWGRLLLSARRSGLDDEYRHYLARARAAGIETVPEAGVVAVLVNAGLIPRKSEGEIFVPGPEGYPVRLVWPRLVSAGCQQRPPLARTSAAGPVALELVEDLDVIAHQSLKDKQGRTIVKMLARAALKQAAARRAEQEFGAYAGLAAQLGTLFSEHADTRSWTTLPGAVYLGLLPLGQGPQRVEVETSAGMREYTPSIGASGVGFVVIRSY